MKLIAVDLDGTLLNHQKRVLDNSREAIARAAQAGVHVVVASGRSLPEARRFVQDTACDRWMISAGGAVIADRHTGERRKAWYIEPSAAAEVVRRGLACELVSFAYVGEQIWMHRVDYEQIFSRMPAFQAQPEMLHLSEDLAADLDVCGGYISKMMCWSLDREKQKRGLEQMADLSGISFTSSGPDNFEVLAAGAGKGAALQWLANDLGIPLSETAAIGDAENDLDMLQAAGYAVAMGNAADCVKEKADFVTGDCETDGIVRALDWLMAQA